MNSRPVIVALIIAILILAVGAIFVNNWRNSVFIPANETRVAMDATQNIVATKTAQEATRFYDATQTMETENLFFTQTAQAENRMQTETAIRHTATHAAVMTLTAMPTNTPEMLMDCGARVVRDNSVINRVPSGSRYLSDSIIVNEGTRVLVNSLVRGSGWVHVLFGDQSGFIDSANITYTDQNCTPAAYDLHFIAGWLAPDWKVLLEDTFTANEHQWFVIETGDQLLPIIQRQRASLTIASEGNVQTFSVAALRDLDHSSINLHVNFGAYPTFSGGYFAFRFNNDQESFSELRFYPRDCFYAVYENNQLSFDANVVASVCIGMYYDLVLRLQPNGSVILMANGEEYGPMYIPGIGNPGSIADIFFSVYNITAQMDYIFVAVPR